MGRLSSADARLVRAIGAELETFRLGGPNGLALAMPGLHEGLRTEKTLGFTQVPRGESTVMGEVQAESVDVPRIRKLMDTLTQSVPIGWTTYNAIRPEPWQRNRVLTVGQIEVKTGTPRHQAPVAARVLTPMGIGHHDQVRVLLCEGPSLLAWIGAWQPDDFNASQRGFFAAIAPLLRRRLLLERSFASMPRTIAALSAALAMIGAPAFITSRSGHIFDANHAGRALHARNPRALVNALRDAATRRPASIPFTMTPLVGTGEGASFLAVALADTRETRLSAALARVSSRWKLTRRQADVLDLVGRGLANRTISAMLGISESTVEFHLAHIFEKAGVDSRASLIALFIESA
jgi:DNA-binding CsgD family transcriptional regulator